MLKIPIHLLLFLLLTSICLSAEESLKNKALQYRYESAYDASNAILQQLIEEGRTTNDNEVVIDALHELAMNYNDMAIYDSTQLYLDSARELLQEIDDYKNHYLYAQQLREEAWLYLLRDYDVEQSIYLLWQTIPLIELYHKDKMTVAIKAYSYLAFAHYTNSLTYSANEFDLAEKYYRKGLKQSIQYNGPKHWETAWFYNGIGMTLIYRALKDRWNEEKINAVIENLKQTRKESEYNIRQGLAIFESYHPVSSGVGKSYHNLGNLNDIYTIITGKKLTANNYLDSLSNFKKQKESYLLGSSYFEKAVLTNKAVFGEKHPYIALPYYCKGLSFKRISDLSQKFDKKNIIKFKAQAWELNKKAIEAIIYDYKRTDQDTLLPLVNSSDHIISNRILSYILGLEYHYINNLWEDSLDIVKKSFCENNIQLLDEWAYNHSFMNATIRELSSKKQFIDQLIILELGKKKVEKNFEKIFKLMELSSNNYLNTEFLSNKRTGVPERLKEREWILTNNESKWLDQLEKATSRQDSLAIFLSLGENGMELDNCRKEIKKYIQFKTVSIPNISEVQQNLNTDQALIRYHLLGNRDTVELHSIVLTQSKVSHQSVNVNRQDYDQHLKIVTIGNDSLRQDFANSSQFFYKSLIDPLEKYISDKKELIILTSGPLLGIPFDALIMKEGGQQEDYHNHQYLIDQYETNVQLSLPIWYEQVTNKKERTVKSIYASVSNHHLNTYSKQDANLQELIQANIELDELEKLFEGRFVNETQASETDFKNHASQMDIIHIASHSIKKATKDNNDTRSIIFASDEINNGLLDDKEIYNLSLNIPLVFLNVCDSNLGKDNSSEGRLNLAHAFISAGAKCVSNTLWKISDVTYSEISLKFYQALKEGKPKSKAMRTAKLAYLNKCRLDNDKMSAHPIHWAGIHLIGDNAPFYFQDSVPPRSNQPLLLLGILILIGTAAYFGKQYYSTKAA